MNVQAIAKQLKNAGLSVLSVTECAEEHDGEVSITERVHIQVPTFGGFPGVVMETADGCFSFYPARKSVSAIVRDVREALGMETA